MSGLVCGAVIVRVLESTIHENDMTRKNTNAFSNTSRGRSQPV